VGASHVEVALDLGVAAERIDTITNFQAAEKYWVKAEGNSAAASATVLAELAALISTGQLEIPIAGTYGLGEVKDAFRELEKRHTRGKIVLRP
jgi:NADPH:quinone reductase-like Zn-dependent oxidoreductase